MDHQEAPPQEYSGHAGQGAEHAAPASTSRYQRILFMVGLVVFALALSIVFLAFRDFFEDMGRWGYLGIFAAMAVNNATVFFPAPGLAILAAAANLFDPLVLGIAAGLGATLGDLVGYALGRSGHWVVAESEFYSRLRRFSNWYGPGLFVFAATPLPFDIAGIFAGAVRYPVWRFVMWVGPGRVIKMIIIAVAGRFAFGWLFDMFGL